MSKILDDAKRLPPGILPAALAGLSTLAFVAGVAFFSLRSCRPAPIPLQVSASVESIATSTASQSIRITIKRPLTFQNTSNTSNDTSNQHDLATPQHIKTPALVTPRKGLLERVAAVIHPAKQSTPPPAPHSGPSVDSSVYEPDYDVMTVEMSQSMQSNAAASIETHIGKPLCDRSDFSSIGIIAGTQPGTIALDIRLAHVGIVGLDVSVNHRMMGAGISAGERFFVEAGGYQAFDGERGLMGAIGVRF